MNLTIPVKKNQYIEMTITGLGHEGQGVGKYEGYTLFVPDSLPGDKIKIKVVKVNKNFGFGRLIEIIESSPNRVQSECLVYKQCGGCQLQHLSYTEQLEWKRTLVHDNLIRIGKIEDIIINPTIGMSNPWNYRNKSQVPFAEIEGGLAAGFYSKGTHQVIDMNECLIQHEQNNRLVQIIRHISEEIGITVYNETTHQGILRHVIVRVGVTTDELMLILVTNGRDFKDKEELVKRIIEEVPNLTSLIQNINELKTNVIMGKESTTLYGQDVIYDTIGDIRFAISPRSFYQVNPEQTKILYDKALEYAGLTGNETVIDAYCGIGTISLFLAQKAKHVYGVEIVPEAIDDAKRNAKINGVTNVTFEVGTAEEILPEWKKRGISAGVIVVDPPRKGCEQALLQAIIEIKPDRIVYVSCNPSTLARDLRILENGGYKAKEAQPVDMFPQTVHVETVVRIERM